MRLLFCMARNIHRFGALLYQQDAKRHRGHSPLLQHLFSVIMLAFYEGSLKRIFIE